MLKQASNDRRVARHLRGVVFSILLGFIGGMICGAVILSGCGLAGRSKTTGAEYVGYWNIGVALVGAMYGALLGMVVGALGYATFIRTIGLEKSIIPATVGTLAGGIAGALLHPLFGLITGVSGFFLALAIVRYSSLKASLKSDP